jgi:hypothetical protein
LGRDLPETEIYKNLEGVDHVGKLNFPGGHTIPLLKKINILNLIGCIIIIYGLFNPWLWRGYDPWTEFDPLKREAKIHYHQIMTTSPFYISIFIDDKLESTIWFINLESSISGATLLSTSILSIFIYKKRYIKLLINLISFSMIILFFLSFGGRGLGIGSITFIGGGLYITLIGLIIIFIASVLDLIF